MESALALQLLEQPHRESEFEEVQSPLDCCLVLRGLLPHLSGWAQALGELKLAEQPLQSQQRAGVEKLQSPSGCPQFAGELPQLSSCDQAFDEVELTMQLLERPHQEAGFEELQAPPECSLARLGLPEPPADMKTEKLACTLYINPLHDSFGISNVNT